MTELRHKYDPRMQVGADIAIWHADPQMEALVVDMLDKCRPNRWYETGTHYGFTSHWLASRYPDLLIKTVELDADYYRIAGENLADFQNVDRYHGDSRAWLTTQVDILKRNPLILPCFWLDAHFWQDHPLKEECRLVAELPRALILIDDYHVGPEFPGDTAAPAMVTPHLGTDYFAPCYPYKHGCSGYILYARGVEYVPPPTMKRNAP
jgi:hypothetical protein